ncbi:hypothetical protein PF010_g4562 [Phytophthora fragariae]|uniref:Uncharacterized protein n=1 Tax=Phytophthora fragariae TaxID=53985 RepID=A0A6G0LRI5_9STRA|nr:hypothetical protein PF010_g4562 [Phytophthora fragariae]KAE9246493.1 hypothetical protein PF004_g4787 [Phytophthora fragariae]KAE9352987.1 hypothetical protein PF008_g5198 [Phytophthora fragariae]
MSRWKEAVMKRPALRLPVSTSPVTRRSQLSPLHSIPPKFRDEGESSSDDDNDAVDMNLEGDLLVEIRTLVKKEKYLEQLESELRDYGDSSEGSENDAMREDLYDDEDEVPLRRSKPRKMVSRSELNDRSGDGTTPGTMDRRSLPARACVDNTSFAKEHFRACFVEVNPVQLREIRTLILASQDLHIHHLRTLSKNLFLFSSLKSVDLSNNQLDDSGSKEIRDLICCPGLQALDLSRNLLGRLTARTICERLRHQAKLQSLDLHGNLFFSDGGDVAREVARLFAKAVAVNEFLLHFRISVVDGAEKVAALSEQWADYAPRRMASRPKNKDLDARSTEISTAATEFSQHLAEQLQQGGKHSNLQSLGLCYAEISRRVVLSTVKMANRLTALDLSFAFVGIPGAQVVAAALRIDGFATLTQLNMRCNRTKSMGAQAILAALHTNERLTFLDLSHNEIRREAADAIAELLQHNKTLYRLDLSENDLVGDQNERELHLLRDAIVRHRGLLSLGQLNSLGANEDQQRLLQDALDHNRIADDQDVLDSINAVPVSRPTDDSAPPRKRHVLSTMVELSEVEVLKTVWQRKITKRGRVSLKWRMAVGRRLSTKCSPLVWKLIVSRKCEVRGSVEDEAAAAQFFHDEDGSSSYELYSAVAYCDKDDTMFLKLGIEDEACEGGAKQQYKMFVKDIVFIPHHPQDRRHVLVSIPRGVSGTAVQWKMKKQRLMVPPPKDQVVDPSSFLWEGVVQRVYIHTSGVFRLLCRVQYPASFTRSSQDTLKSHYWWQLQRSSCWDLHTNHIVLEGTYFELYGVLRFDREMGFSLPPMEWMAGEYLQLSVTTPNDDVVLRVVQFQLFHEVANWERASATPCLNLTHLRLAKKSKEGTIASQAEIDGEGVPATPIPLPHSIRDDDEGGPPSSRRSSLRSRSPSPPLLQLEETEEKSPVEQDISPPTVDDIPSPGADMLPPVQPLRQNSAPRMETVSWALTTNMEPILPTTSPPKLGAPGTSQQSKRRITYSVDEISPHALDRLGVNADILKKEKGMKKLGICDVDIVRSEELRRYTGVSQLEPTSKVEFMFGFNDEQLHRERAIKRLGTSEQEIMDDYSRKVSRLGITNSPPLKL